MHFAIYWRNLVKCARFRIFFLLSALLCLNFANSLYLSSINIRHIAIYWRNLKCARFRIFSLVSALFCLNFAYSFYLSSINAMHIAIYWRNLKCARFGIFFSCQLYFILISLSLCIWARSTPCILQSIGVIWRVVDLDFFSLVSFTLSIGVIRFEPDLEFFSLVSFTLS